MKFKMSLSHHETADKTRRAPAPAVVVAWTQAEEMRIIMKKNSSIQSTGPGIGWRLPRIALVLMGCLVFLAVAITPSAGVSRAVTLRSGAQAIDKADQAFWDKKFSNPKTEFNRQPSRLLVEAVRGRTAGTALDLGMGEGRNAVYLAHEGWQVTGVDMSDVAIAQAKAHAAKAGINLDAVLDGLDHYDFGRNRWDLIILFYLHAWYNSARPRSALRIYDALKPGGLLVIEGFAGKPKYMFQPNELLRDFTDLRVLRYEDTQGDADWAPGRKSHIIRFVGEKEK
jgi:SAM-dependent methyltransferase